MKSAPRVSDAAERKGINMGFLLGGYSSDEPLGESWSVEIKNGVAGHPVELRKKHDPGISWGGQGEVLSRIVQGYSPALFQILAQTMRGQQGPVSEKCRVTVRHFFRYLHRRCVGNKDPFQRTSYHRSSVQPSCTCKLQSSSPPCQFRTQLTWLVFWYILPSCLADLRLVHKLSAAQ